MHVTAGFYRHLTGWRTQDSRQQDDGCAEPTLACGEHDLGSDDCKRRLAVTVPIYMAHASDLAAGHFRLPARIVPGVGLVRQHGPGAPASGKAAKSLLGVMWHSLSADVREAAAASASSTS